MKIFIDTAEISEIEEAASTGLIDGVTTNPSLVAKAGVPFTDLLRRICELVDGSVSAEVTALDHKGMLEEAKPLAEIHPNITIKLPLTFEGLKACRTLTEQKIQTNVTLCFSATQALLAAKAGATYISPFIGRLDDVGQDGLQLISDIRQIYSNFGYETQILSASIRNVPHVVQVASMGSDVATLPFKIFKQLIHHPLTDQGLESFLKDWEKAKK